MNYIKRLELERAELQDRAALALDTARQFRAHLHSSKFQGVDQDGDRKDWIAVQDVLAYLDSIEAALTE